MFNDYTLKDLLPLIELDEFISAVKNNSEFSVDGREGLKSLSFALEMINSANKME